MTEAPESIEAVDTMLYVKSMRMDETGAHFEFQSDIIPIIANGLAGQMKEMGGINYVGWEIDHTELGPLILTLQRRWGETPERQARDRLVEIERLQSENERLRTDLAARESAIRTEERERCLSAVENEALTAPSDSEGDASYDSAIQHAAEAIRALAGGVTS